MMSHRLHLAEYWAFPLANPGTIQVLYHAGSSITQGADFDVTQTSLTYGWGVLLRFQVQVGSLQTGQSITQGICTQQLRFPF